MSTDLRLQLRSPGCYDLARAALAEMERRGVWPTPQNYELWLHIAADPDGPLKAEVDQLTREGAALTEAQSEALAAQRLGRSPMDQVRAAGEGLEQQLRLVRRAIESAQQSSAEYGRALAGASRDLGQDLEPVEMQRLVETLAEATLQVRRQNSAFESGLSASGAEVVRLRERLAAAQREAATDALTSLPNRKAFDSTLAQACAEAAETGRPLALAILDIDHFKRFNDTWGHQTGDQVIRYVASVLSRAVDPPLVAARYGGEEFALILPGQTAAQATAMLDRLREEIGSRNLKRRSTNEDLGHVTVSSGVAQHGRGETPAAFVERADAALYASKRNGRNRVTRAREKETA